MTYPDVVTGLAWALACNLVATVLLTIFNGYLLRRINQVQADQLARDQAYQRQWQQQIQSRQRQSAGTWTPSTDWQRP